MKMILSLLALAASATMGVLALGQNCTTVYFKTPGPDAYKDGRSVLPGEFYALVWSAKGHGFYGFNADVSLVSNGVNAVIVMYPKAKASRNDSNKVYLPKCGIDLTPEQTVAYGQNGTLHIVLLDTRKSETELCDKIDAGNNTYKPMLVNGYENVASVTTGAAVAAGTFSIDSPISITKLSGIPADAPRPVITDVALREGGNGREMVLTVKGTAAYLRYTAGDAKSVDHRKVADSTTEYGLENPDDVITIVVPAKDNMRLFQIIRD